ARSPARWTECTEAYGPRLWRGSAAGAVNVRGYLSTGAQRPFPEDWAKPKPEIGGRPGPLRFRRWPPTRQLTRKCGPHLGAFRCERDGGPLAAPQRRASSSGGRYSPAELLRRALRKPV